VFRACVRRSGRAGRPPDHGRSGARQALPGSLSWGGINNTYFWIDLSRGIAGVILMQYLPFADAKALAVYDAFERGAYATQ
jgi:CubicO group peptidase (beta-lactamase class C family)